MSDIDEDERSSSEESEKKVSEKRALNQDSSIVPQGGILSGDELQCVINRFKKVRKSIVAFSGSVFDAEIKRCSLPFFHSFLDSWDTLVEETGYTLPFDLVIGSLLAINHYQAKGVSIQDIFYPVTCQLHNDLSEYSKKNTGGERWDWEPTEISALALNIHLKRFLRSCDFLQNNADCLVVNVRDFLRPMVKERKYFEFFIYSVDKVRADAVFREFVQCLVTTVAPQQFSRCPRKIKIQCGDIRIILRTCIYQSLERIFQSGECEIAFNGKVVTCSTSGLFTLCTLYSLRWPSVDETSKRKAHNIVTMKPVPEVKNYSRSLYELFDYKVHSDVGSSKTLDRIMRDKGFTFYTFGANVTSDLHCTQKRKGTGDSIPDLKSWITLMPSVVFTWIKEVSLSDLMGLYNRETPTVASFLIDNNVGAFLEYSRPFTNEIVARLDKAVAFCEAGIWKTEKELAESGYVSERLPRKFLLQKFGIPWAKLRLFLLAWKFPSADCGPSRLSKDLLLYVDFHYDMICIERVRQHLQKFVKCK